MTKTTSDARRDRVFDALADPTRRQIVELLVGEPEATISWVAGHFPVSRQAITKHLNALQEAGIVDIESRGRERIVTVRPGSLDAASAWLDDVGRQWDERLAALRMHLEKSQGQDR
jgi:DNA-binding transcriptional ArsR family regulator